MHRLISRLMTRPMRSAVLLAAVNLGVLFGAARLPAQEGETAEERAQALVDLLQAASPAASGAAGSSGAPSVLGDLDLDHASLDVKKIARALRGTRLDLVVDKQDPFSVVNILRDASGLSFVVSRKAREALKEEKREVTLSLRGLTLENILNLLAMHLGDYRFTVKYGAVMLVHKDEHRPRTVTRVYVVDDLLRPRRDFPAPRLGLGTLDEKQP